MSADHAAGRPPGAHAGAAGDGDDAAAALPTASETARRLDPRIRWLWLVAGLLVLIQILIAVALLDFLVPHPLPDGRVTLIVALGGLVGAAVVPLLRYARWRYVLREQDLWLRQGLLTVTVSVIPYRRLQFVDTRQGPLDRVFGLSQLVVHTAALGTAGRLPGLDADHAERLRERLAQLEPDDALA
jgi:membrane protein YdbS with pleckstrin-like domain